MSYSCLSEGSIPTVGSSNIISLGLCNKETPRDTLLLWPPLKEKKFKNKINNRTKIIKKSKIYINTVFLILPKLLWGKMKKYTLFRKIKITF